jgi:hypothetical protein
MSEEEMLKVELAETIDELDKAKVEIQHLKRLNEEERETIDELCGLIVEAIGFVTDECVISECCGIVSTKQRDWINRAIEATAT